jgi:hypothetical protein
MGKVPKSPPVTHHPTQMTLQGKTITRGKAPVETRCSSFHATLILLRQKASSKPFIIREFSSIFKILDICKRWCLDLSSHHGLFFFDHLCLNFHVKLHLYQYSYWRILGGPLMLIKARQGFFFAFESTYVHGRFIHRVKNPSTNCA